VAPQACVRVYVRVLVPPNLYIHTYIPPLLCNILHNITSYCTPPPSVEVFILRSLEVFLFFRGRILDLDGGWVEVFSKKKSVLDTERRHYCTLLCNTPLPPSPPLLPIQYCAIFNTFSPRPRPPLYCILLQ